MLLQLLVCAVRCSRRQQMSTRRHNAQSTPPRGHSTPQRGPSAHRVGDVVEVEKFPSAWYTATIKQIRPQVPPAKRGALPAAAC